LVIGECRVLISEISCVMIRTFLPLSLAFTKFLLPRDKRRGDRHTMYGEVATVNRNSTTRKLILFLSAAAIFAATLTGFSQVPAGAPNVSGVWGWGRCIPAAAAAGGARGARGGGGINCMVIEPDDPKLTDRARAFQKAFDEIAAPKYDCAPMSIPHMYTDPYAFKIEQQRDRVIISYEKDDVVRTVWMDGFGHKKPALNQFFVHGYSTGRYEGNTLVVETTRFTFDPMGLNSDFKMPTSSQKRVTERFSLEGDALAFEVKTEDTFFLKEPWIYRVRSQRQQGELSLPWDCNLKAARQSLELLTTDYPKDPPVVRLPEGQ